MKEKVFYNDGIGKVQFTEGIAKGYNEDNELVIERHDGVIIKIPKNRVIRREVSNGD